VPYRIAFKIRENSDFLGSSFIFTIMKKNITVILFGLVLVFAISSCKAGDCGCPKFEIEAKSNSSTQPLIQEKR